MGKAFACFSIALHNFKKWAVNPRLYILLLMEILYLHSRLSPVGELCLDGEKLTIGGGKIGPVAQKLYDTLTGIQYGRLPDENHWVMKI